MHYQEIISQSTKWHLASQDELDSIRLHTNKRAREWLAQPHATDAAESTLLLPVSGLASIKESILTSSSSSYGPTNDANSHPLLTPHEESLLLSFYASKIPHLIGPHASHPKCQRQAKVSATACLLFRRFYLSNSVMMYDPKPMSVACAFLSSKIEDCMLDVRYLESVTREMNAPVSMEEILRGEIDLLRGVDFDLVLFHPYKTVLACTEDLRVYLKSERGRGLVGTGGSDSTVVDTTGRIENDKSSTRLISGEDLRPMHDAAMKICDDVIVSDIPLLYGPGEVGLAALMVANEDICKESMGVDTDDGESGSSSSVDPATKKHPTKIDIIGYIQSRFQDLTNEPIKIDSNAIDTIVSRVVSVGIKIRELREGKHGCGNYNVDMEALKGVHKKLKKCRAWGQSDKKKKKKRKAEET